MRVLGFEVEVIVYFDEVDTNMLQAFESAEVRVCRLGLRRGSGLFAQLRLAAALARALWRGPRPALVWLQYLTPTLLPLLVAKPFARRLVAAVEWQQRISMTKRNIDCAGWPDIGAIE
ncbi:MAG: hypothetical protein IPO95_13385 [Rhodanobacteraceae bacterium]|nr:hypothetical protein [Rhodanobacteraceae bacterium]